MTSVVTEYADALTEALKNIPGVRVYSDAAGIDSPPAVYVGPPVLTWDSYDSDPTEGTFTVYLMVAKSDRAQQQLQELLPAVAVAVDEVPDAVVKQARPGVSGPPGAELPAYQIDVHVSLGGHP